MMIPRTIGYQEKTAKHATAPKRNAYPVRLFRSLRARLPVRPRGGRGRCPDTSAAVPGAVRTAMTTPE
jgi:hypothetical protein